MKTALHGHLRNKCYYFAVDGGDNGGPDLHSNDKHLLKVLTEE